MKQKQKEEKEERVVKKEKKKERRYNLLAFSGSAALIALAVSLAISAVNAHTRKRKGRALAGSNVRVNLSAPEILQLANNIISKSKVVHDAVGSVPVDKATFANVVLPLAELEAQQFPLVQSCIFPKLVSTSEEVRKVSAEAEQRIDAHILMCSRREDIRDFEWNDLNLTSTKREEVQRLRSQIYDLSVLYVRNMSDDSNFLLFSETELVGLPPEFLQSLDKAENGKFKVYLRSCHAIPVLELCKVWSS